MIRITFLIFGLMIMSTTFAQSGEESPFVENDTVRSGPIIFTTESASGYIMELIKTSNLWNPSGDTLKLSLSRLIAHFNEPFDSVESRLARFKYDSINPRQADIVRNDTLPLRWLNDSTYIIDTVVLKKVPLVNRVTIVDKEADTAFIEEDLPDMEALVNHMLHDQDTITEVVIDTAFLESEAVQIYQVRHSRISPSIVPQGGRKSARFLTSSDNIIISDTVKVIIANPASPFHILSSEKMPDSLRLAVETLLSYTNDRDSIPLFINDIRGRKTSFALTTKNDDLYRYWVKNFKNDSVTVWMGNPSKHEITLILEDDINVSRIKREAADDIPFTQSQPDLSLAKVVPLKVIPVYWDYSLASSITLNQTYLSNWSKGGENSLAGVLEFQGTAKYTDTENKTQWTNSVRNKYANIITEEYGWRTNTDMLELNSQYNKILKGKIDLSTVFYMKTQIARGYKYPNDSVVVSKFLNPGTFTLGVGLEYKPFKNTSLNFSVLSYKNTFVLDTAHINQTAHGIDADQRFKQEMGGQLLVKNTMSVLKGLNVINTLRLFSGYNNKPENIDVDWEINLEKRITWYFGVRLNLHMIYDDDIRFAVLDDNDEPVLRPDGSEKMSPKLQFKEFLGFSFIFKF